MGTQPYLGSIHIFAFTFAPRGYAFCRGQILAIQTNTALFSLLGTTYGGNGQSTFALPDLQSRVPVSFGQGPGLSYYALGQLGGSETVTLNVTQLPAHNHSLATSASTLSATQTKASAAVPAAGSLLARSIDGANGGTASPQIYVPAGTAGTQVALGGLGGTTAPAGNNQPTPIIQPYLALNFCIALQGIFPSRN